MTLEEYKQQVTEIKEASENFKGTTQEEAVKFFEDLANKYPQVNEFNTKGMDCKDLKEFKNLADAFGMKFSSEDSAEKLYSMLQEGKKQLKAATLKTQNGTELSDDALSTISGGQKVLSCLWILVSSPATLVASMANDQDTLDKIVEIGDRAYRIGDGV